MLELHLGFIILIVVLAFLFEYLDSTLGMGYGTTLTPALLIMGFKPLHIVPVVLLSELITGFLASFFHHQEGNVNLKPKTTNFSIIARKLKSLGYIESFKRGIPLDLKVALLLGSCSLLGTIVAVFVAVNISKFWLEFYIGCLVLCMGIVIFVTLDKNYRFSWKKVIGLGLIASFNKGMSGGGYGPIVTGGQILTGVTPKSSIGITSFAEGLTCIVGIIGYLLISKKPVNWQLAPYLITGAVLSVPFTAKSVKALTEKKLKLAVATITIILGTITLLNTFKMLG